MKANAFCPSQNFDKFSDLIEQIKCEKREINRHFNTNDEGFKNF